MPLSVSVALCTYNGARFIEEQLRSILAQDHPVTEIVVADDGSTDGTLDLVRSIASRRHSVQVRVLDVSARLGVTANFERAITSCVGDIVALSDQDDVWHPARISAALPAFDDDQQLLLQHADARLVNEDGRDLGLGLLQTLKLRPDERELVRGGHPFPVYIRRNLVTGATVLFRRERVMASSAGFPTAWVHDEWLAVIAAALGRVELLDAQLIDYRQHDANQIGVSEPTLRRRAGRMLEPRSDRYVRLADRAVALAERLERLDVPPDYLVLARDKARFETVRASYPRSRAARLGPILAERRRGSYRDLSSQGNLDLVRDLLQPA